MIAIESAEYYGWRNRLAPVPVLLGVLRLGAAPERLPAAPLAALHERFPGLESAPDGSDLPRLVAGLAQQLQREADVTPAASGVADRRGDAARIFFAAHDPHTASVSLTAAVELVKGMVQDTPQFARLIEVCAGAVHKAGLGPIDHAVITAVAARGIPWHRVLDGRSHVRLGQGARAQLTRQSMTSRQSALGRELARDKLTSYQLLSGLGLPVGGYGAPADRQEALRLAATIGYPVALKPAKGSRGTDVFPHLRDAAELSAVFDSVAGQHEGFVLQSHFPGQDYRLLVVAGRLTAAARFETASVTGDGVRSVAELVAGENRDPRRGGGVGHVMSPIVLDAESGRVLAGQGLAPDAVPAAGRRVIVKGNANLAGGGPAIDVTARVHPDNAMLAVRAARALEADVAGIDFITPDIAHSWRELGGGICEVNLFPGLRMHHLADPDSDAAGPIVESLFPPGDEGRIPLALVAGPGAAKVAALVERMLAAAGHVAGIAAGGEVRIGGQTVAEPPDASPVPLVLRDPMVTAAVIEIDPATMDEGLPVERCDVAATLPSVVWTNPAHEEAFLATGKKRLTLETGDPAALALAIAAALGVESKFMPKDG